jgi:hypothetical protein
MAKVLGRVTGAVLDTETRSGTSKAGNPYTMRTCSVIVCNRAIIGITLVDSQAPPAVGEEIDWLVDLTVFGTEVQGRFVSDFPVAVKGVRAAS